MGEKRMPLVRFGKELFFSEKRKGPFLSFSPLDVRTGW
jgi:hypothetical protein